MPTSVMIILQTLRKHAQVLERKEKKSRQINFILTAEGKPMPVKDFQFEC